MEVVVEEEEENGFPQQGYNLRSGERLKDDVDN